MQKYSTCDDCGETFPTDLRHVVVQPRPSDPTDLCAILWMCTRCGVKGDLPTVPELESRLAAGQLGNIVTLTV